MIRQTNRDYIYRFQLVDILRERVGGGERMDKDKVVWKLFKEAGGGIEQKTCYLYDKCPK